MSAARHAVTVPNVLRGLAGKPLGIKPVFKKSNFRYFHYIFHYKYLNNVLTAIDREPINLTKTKLHHKMTISWKVWCTPYFK